MSTTAITNHPALNGEVTKSPPALPNTSIPPPKPVAQHGLLMKAVAAGKTVVNVAGVAVKDLTVHSPSPVSR